jgi:hypothetical protein
MSQTKKKPQEFSDEQTQTATNTKPEISIHTNPLPPILQPIIKDDDDRRGNPRHKIEFETVIFCAGVSFRTKTLNVSITGALLSENIPSAFVGQILDIVMIHYVGRVREFYLVKGKSLEGPMRSPRLLFTQVPEAQKKKLERLFETLEKV